MEQDSIRLYYKLMQELLDLPDPLRRIIKEEQEHLASLHSFRG